MTARFRTFSQAPQAVRSAGGRRWDQALPAGAPAGRTLQPNKCDTFGLTVQVHRLRNVSSTAAVRAVVRSHSSPPSWLRAFSTTWALNSPKSVLRYESRTRISYVRPRTKSEVTTSKKSRSRPWMWGYYSSTQRCRSAPAHWLPENRSPRSVGESRKVLEESAEPFAVLRYLC